MKMVETRKSKNKKMIAIKKEMVKTLLIMLEDSHRIISINDFKLTYLE